MGKDTFKDERLFEKMICKGDYKTNGEQCLKYGGNCSKLGCDYYVVSDGNPDASTGSKCNKHIVNNRFWSDAEKNELWDISENWQGEIPVYKFIAEKLNKKFNNNRTPAACRAMDIKLAKENGS